MTSKESILEHSVPYQVYQVDLIFNTATCYTYIAGSVILQLIKSCRGSLQEGFIVVLPSFIFEYIQSNYNKNNLPELEQGCPMQCFSFKCNLHDTTAKGTALTQRKAVFKIIIDLRGNFFPGFLMLLIEIRDQRHNTEKSPISPKVL